MKLSIQGMPAGMGKRGNRPQRKHAKSVEERVERFPAAQAAPNNPSASGVLLKSQLILEQTIHNVLQLPLFPHLHTQYLCRALHSLHSVSYTLTLPIHPLIYQPFHQQFLQHLRLQCLNHPSLWCSSLGLYQSVLVALTIILNLKCLHMTCVLSTLNGGHLH